ncbi:hypothetical protein NDU88_002640 [Pleurodeles waltl]|uniref:Endonuclease/exonuclease/phosphatase domain-containing protein n=1 Tax=Pleurodeles waltl TaxID=8319 RepID=A0AAV7RF46_PLEWA|nr:hypothetical protein NDU88_002638 [Pleurodeles waltl]KAJ1149838.1 hypothetical protein NDU88_002640 [Pleurodeles waltl]KAJ1149839.1 hypothetical protein NDU88_002640 [Pleurodeles waltl]KAJ1149840.1 hypothetical protein NDU88_002640 [Pleurodeles waltl]
MRICTIYAPAQKVEREHLFHVIKPFLTGTIPLILVGDFNCIMHINDRQGQQNTYSLDVTSKVLKTLLYDVDLYDTYAKHYSPGTCFTWEAVHGHARSRIDFVFASKTLVATKCCLTPVAFSDHRCLHVTFELPAHPIRGPGYWKLNCQLLENALICQKYRRCYAKWAQNKTLFSSNYQWWRWVKCKTKMFFQSQAALLRKEVWAQFQHLQRRLLVLQQLSDAGKDVSEEVRHVKTAQTLWLHRKETEVPDDITVDPNFPLAIDPHEITQQIVQEELDRLDAQKIKNRALEQRQKRAKPHPTDPTPPPPTTVIPSVSQNESPVPDCIPETPLEDLISHPRATTSHIAPPAHVVASSSSPQVSLQKLPAAPDMDHSGWTTYFSSKRKTKSTKVTDTPAPTRAKRRTTSLDRPSSGSRYAPLTHLSDSEEDHHHVAQELKVRTGPVPDFEATPDLEALFPASLLPDAQRFGTEADDLSSPE